LLSWVKEHAESIQLLSAIALISVGAGVLVHWAAGALAAGLVLVADYFKG